jgi:glyoxylase-like metal-dependent hydrolase (beta-lactamase superfamily II)
MAGARESLEITPEELIQKRESGTPIRILDVRAPQAAAASRIDVFPDDRYQNIRGSEILAMGDRVSGSIGLDGPIAVVCAHGNDSKVIAAHLNRLGYQALSLHGGMAGWANAVVARRLAPPAGFDHLVQFDRIAKGALGYLIAARDEALIVDPPRKARAYVEMARSLDLKIVAVADTHVHADYISGAPMLSHSLKIPYYLHPADSFLPYDNSPGRITFTAKEEGGSIVVGGSEVHSVHTPGHTEGSLTFIAGDTALTGDFIFIDSVGRPDLGGKLDEWTPVLWTSLERARETWKPEWRILPAHYASDAEREPDHSVGRPFGSLPERNEPLRIRDGNEFLAWVKRKVTPSPEVYRKIKAVNLGLLEVWDAEAQEMESGRNECALG